MSLGHPDRSVLVAFRWSMQCLMSILSVLPWLVSLKNEYVWYIGIGACSKATWYCGVHYMK